MFTVDFVYTPSHPRTGTAVNFTAIPDSGVPPYYFAWNFTDNNQTPQGQQVMHTFSTNGNFKVVLAARDSTGLVVTAEKNVQVVPPAITLDYTYNPQTPEAGTHIVFRASVAGGLPPYTVLFDFGDHHTENKTRSSHTYYIAGNYTVTLTVQDSYGQTNSTAKTIMVTPFVPISQQPSPSSSTTGNSHPSTGNGGAIGNILAQPLTMAAFAMLGLGCAAMIVFWRKPFSKIRKK